MDLCIFWIFCGYYCVNMYLYDVCIINNEFNE